MGSIQQSILQYWLTGIVIKSYSSFQGTAVRRKLLWGISMDQYISPLPRRKEINKLFNWETEYSNLIWSECLSCIPTQSTPDADSPVSLCPHSIPLVLPALWIGCHTSVWFQRILSFPGDGKPMWAFPFEAFPFGLGSEIPLNLSVMTG